MEKNTEGKLVMTETKFDESVERVVKRVVESAGLTRPIVPAAVAGDGGRQITEYDFNPVANETPSQRKNRIIRASTAISGGNLAVEKAPKEIKAIRFFRAYAEGDMATVKALSEGSATDGGNLVPIEFGTDLLVAIEQYSLSAQADNYEMGSSELDLRTVTTKPIVYQVSEGVAPTASASKFGKPILTAKAFAGLQIMSKEVFVDNNVGLYDKLVVLFAEAFGAKESAEIITGTAFTGIMTSVTPTTETLVGTSIITDIKYQNLVNVVNSLSPGQLMNGGQWVMHRKVWGYISSLVDNNNRPIVNNPWDAKARTLLGYPVTLDEQAPSTDASNTGFIVFGNLKWVAFGRRQGFAANVYKEGTFATINVGETRQLALLIDARWGLVVTIPANIAILKTHA